MADAGNEQPTKKQKLEDVSLAGAVDTSATQAFDNQALTKEERTSEQRETAKIFGSTQGPAGSSVPEPPSASEAETGQSQEQPSEFEPGIVAIEERLHNGDQEGADIALRAADKAKMLGSSNEAVLDALEAAEDAYDSAHGNPETAQGSMAQRLSSRLEGAEGSRSPAASSSSGRNGSRGGVLIDESNRQKIRAKLLAALQKSAPLSSLPEADLVAHASSCEEACHSSSSSRPVYFSKAGNISRLAKSVTVDQLHDLPRIASGQAKEVAEGTVTDGATMRDNVAGLQGIAMK